MSVLLFLIAIISGIVLARKLRPSLARIIVIPSLIIAIIGLIPVVFTDYDYVIRFMMHGFTALVVFGITFLLELSIQKGRSFKGWKIVLIVIVLAYGALVEAKGVFSGAFGTENITLRSWPIKEYTVLHRRHSGWVGGSWETYQLRQYALGGLLYKALARAYPSEQEDCLIDLVAYDKSATYSFNKCEVTLVKTQ